MPAKRALVLIPLLWAALSAQARAQVGHDPAHSPYRTLRYGQFIELIGGRLRGDGGELGVAPHSGTTAGLRYTFLANSTVSLAFQGSYADLERFVVDPTKPIATAISGPVKQHAIIGEALLQFNVTGGKTWHRLAPFISGGIGLVRASSTAQDQSGFNFKTRFTLTPGIGARIFLNDRLFLRVEARSVFWSVTYPASFREPPTTATSEPPVLAAPNKEWVANGWYTIGLGYAFSRPF
jgi:opacity protein-like surface antigen